MIGLTPGVDGVDPQALRSNPDSTGQLVAQNLSTQAGWTLIHLTTTIDVVAQIDGPAGPSYEGFVGLRF